MKKLLVLWLLFFPVFVTGAVAQTQEPPDPGDVPATETIDLGPLGTFELLPDEPIQVCVLSRTDGPVGSTVVVIEAYLTPDGPFADAPKVLRALGPLSASQPLDCLVLRSES